MRDIVRIRRAAARDAPRIASLLRDAFAEYEQLYTKAGYKATTPDRDEILARMREGPLWVAVTKARIVGTAAAVHRSNGVYIRSMAVLPEARGLGVGRRLLEKAESFAIGNGCHRLFLSTTPFLDRAIRLYESFGFHATDAPPHDLFGTPLFTMEKLLTGS